MTFQTAAYAVDGNQESGNFLRLMFQSATLGSQGVIGHLDCQVQANGPATAGVNITSGAVAVLGQEVSFQGSYYGYNVGTDSSVTISPTGGSSRSDMVVIRAEDPTFSGSPWGGPPAGQILFPRVIQNVSPGSLVPPGGISAIPLARIDMPASTSVVQSSYINDLRQVCNPQRALQVVTSAGSGGGTNTSTSTTPTAWPPGASWSVQVPTYATQLRLMWVISGVIYGAGSNYGGFIGPLIGTSVTSPVVSMPTTAAYYTTGSQSVTISGGAGVNVPASIRGTTVTLQFAQQGDGTDTGQLAYWKGSSTAVVLEWQQQAAAV